MRKVIVVGSGAGSVHATYTLAEAGVHVTMLDVANTDTIYKDRIPEKDFLKVRQSDVDQWKYFLGENFEGVPFGPVRVGAQLTPPRQFISKDFDAHQMIATEGFHALQSLALGGLAAGWGAATPAYIDSDIQSWPINRSDLEEAYDVVGKRVGIAGTDNDDLADYFGLSDYLLPPACMDGNGQAIYRNYLRKKSALAEAGIALGAPRIALATKEFRGRGPASYHDMDFWSDHERAVYRPVYTVEELKRFSNFEFKGGYFVKSFSEDENGVSISTLNTNTGEKENFQADSVFLGAGNIGSTRIVLQSLDMPDAEVPILSNPYTYYPCILPSRLGKSSRRPRHSLTQLMGYFNDPENRSPTVQIQAYSYRSLLNFKLLKEAPLPIKEAIPIFRLLQSSFTILGIHHEDCPSSNKAMRLVNRSDNKENSLEVKYELDQRQEQQIAESEKKITRAFRKLGCYALKRIYPGHGSSIHYGGSLPMSKDEETLTSRVDGSISGTKNVYVVDGSGFPTLPAKGLTFTIMANAHRIAKEYTKKSLQ